jgi:hypothetical protein
MDTPQLALNMQYIFIAFFAPWITFYLASALGLTIAEVALGLIYKPGPNLVELAGDTPIIINGQQSPVEVQIVSRKYQA